MIEEIRTFQRRQPFKPFEIVMVDGRVFPVRQPEFILVPPGRGAWIYVTDERGHVEHLNVVVISSVRLSRGTPRTRRRRAG